MKKNKVKSFIDRKVQSINDKSDQITLIDPAEILDIVLQEGKTPLNIEEVLDYVDAYLSDKALWHANMHSRQAILVASHGTSMTAAQQLFSQYEKDLLRAQCKNIFIKPIKFVHKVFNHLISKLA